MPWCKFQFMLWKAKCNRWKSLQRLPDKILNHWTPYICCCWSDHSGWSYAMQATFVQTLVEVQGLHPVGGFRVGSGFVGGVVSTGGPTVGLGYGQCCPGFGKGLPTEMGSAQTAWKSRFRREYRMPSKNNSTLKIVQSKKVIAFSTE